MYKRIPFIIMIAILVAVAAGRVGQQPVMAQDPTIPTRTPTPDPNRPPPTQPSPVPPPGGGGDNNPPPQATNTPLPDQSANPSPTPLQPLNPGIVSSPVATTTQGEQGGINSGLGVPGSDVCDETPYIITLSRITVHAGPGLDYPVVTTLEKDEIRPIIGRAGFATWWQIQISPRLVGWVLDDEVDEFGNTAIVPIVVPPMLNGVAPTPGAPWEPTPLPFVRCLPTATPSPTPTPTAEPTGAFAAGGTNSDSGASPQESTGASSSTSSDTNQGQANSATSSSETDAAVAAAGVSERGLSASRSDGNANSGSSTNLILPLAGIGLIAAGILIALMTRNRGGTPPSESPPAEL